jgi:hypothetical protein
MHVDQDYTSMHAYNKRRQVIELTLERFEEAPPYLRKREATPFSISSSLQAPEKGRTIYSNTSFLTMNRRTNRKSDKFKH